MIDFHTHIFPDSIAESTVSYLQSVCHTVPFTDGTKSGLYDSMEKSGISCSVILPVVTKPSQFRSVNEFAAAFQEGKLISFGGIHPLSKNYKEELKYIKELGLRGIKLHPDYQGTYFNDISYKRILSYASELDLIVSVHAGADPKCPEDIHCTPQMALEIIEEVRPSKLVLAHMGGNALWDDVERYLVGRDVYFDTAVVLDRIPKEQLLRMVKNHGADRILFATDSPWAGQKEFVSYFMSLPLTEKEKKRILYENAEQLLKR